MTEELLNSDALRWQINLTELGHLTSELIWAHDSELTVPIRSKRYQAPGQSAFLILKGELEVETDAGQIRAGVGNWCFPHQGLRLLRMDTGGHILTVRFRILWPGDVPLFNHPVAVVFPASDAPKLEIHARKLVRAVNRAVPGAKMDLPWRKVDLLSYFRLQTAMGGWLHAYTEAMLQHGMVPSRLAKIDPRILTTLSWIDNLPVNYQLTESELIEVSGLSASQLNRLSMQHLSMTFMHYFDCRKLTNAKMLIRSSPLLVKQMAFSLGFSSVSSFSRWFRKHTGQSPREFKSSEQV